MATFKNTRLRCKYGLLLITSKVCCQNDAVWSPSVQNHVVEEVCFNYFHRGPEERVGISPADLFVEFPFLEVTLHFYCFLNERDAVSGVQMDNNYAYSIAMT